MKQTTLTGFASSPNNEEVKAKPLIVNEEHIDAIYEASYERELERIYEHQIREKLREEESERFQKRIGVQI